MMDIIIKIFSLFFVFYGGIAISAFIGKKIREKQEDKKEMKEEK